jgi:plasmid maintenance system antidote protein VapI
MKLKQKNISKLLGVTDAFISMVLSGKRSISYPMAKKLNALTRIEKDFWMEANADELRKAFKLLETENKEVA